MDDVLIGYRENSPVRAVIRPFKDQDRQHQQFYLPKLPAALT